MVGEATAGPFIKYGGKVVSTFANFTSERPADPPLSELKVPFKKARKSIGHRFIATIDDLGLLEPTEAVEILGLARSVVDFPNVTYVLSESVENAACIKKAKIWKFVNHTALGV